MNAVRVRVVAVGERRGRAWMVGLSGGLGLVAYAMGIGHDVVRTLALSRFLVVGVLLVTWIAGTVLARRPRPEVVLARVEGGMLRAGPFVVPADDALTASVARGERGYSIAMARDGDGAFFEIETEREARRLLALAGVPWPGRGSPEMVARQEVVRLVQRAVGTIGLACAIGYAVAVGMFDATDYKSTFGIPALLFGLLSSALFVADPMFRRRLVVGSRREHVLGRTRIDTHLRLHDRSHVRPLDDVLAPPAPAERHARAGMLEAGDEPTRAWLDRVDALGRGAEGYRGDAPTADELSAIVADPDAAISARLASARLLATRHGVGEAELRARIADDALAPRVRIVLAPDAADAAAALDTAEPVFEAEKARLL